MINTARIAEMIRDPSKTDGIPKAIEEGAVHKMQSFHQHLVELVIEGLVDREEAANAASNRHDFELALQHAIKAKAAAESGDGLAVEVDDIARLDGAQKPIGGLRVSAS
jgi:Tfp pilus assembly ATPase PilU